MNAAFARLVLELCSYGQILDTHLSQLQCLDVICCLLPLETAIRKAKWAQMVPIARGKEQDCCAVGQVGISPLSKLAGSSSQHLARASLWGIGCFAAISARSRPGHVVAENVKLFEHG